MEKLIRLITVQDVSDFVKTVSEKCKHTVLAKQGIYTVNASSILGMYSLDLMRWAWDCYRRFIQMYSDVVMEVGKKYFEELIDKIRSAIPFGVGDYIWVDGYSDNLMHPAIVERIIIEEKTLSVEWVSYDYGIDCTEVWDDGLADISEIHWGEEMKNIIEEEEKYYDMSGKSRY